MQPGASEVDAYLAQVPEPKRSTLETLRARILEVVPEAEQCISYAMPAFRLNGKVVAGFAAFKNHLAFLPHSGRVIPELSDELAGFTYTPGSLHFAIDECLSPELVRLLIETRIAQLER